MRKKLITSVSIAGMLALTACTTADRDRAIVGGAAGAVVGGVTTGTLEGAAAGAAIGAGGAVLLGRLADGSCRWRDERGRVFTAPCR